MKLKYFKSNGKLLLTGEYVVLDGATALAVPTQYGQSLKVTPIDETKLIWKSFDDNGAIWFEGTFDTDFKILKYLENTNVAKRLEQIFSAVKTLNPKFLTSNHGFEIETHLEFPKNWGLGTSSTLINNIAQWTNVNPYELLRLTFGGSGYDVACAQHDTPITYQLLNSETQGDSPLVVPVDFNPPFKDHLYFVYLNKKQNSRDGIAHYKSISEDLTPVISEIDHITNEILECKDLVWFQKLIEIHENIIGKLTKQEVVKSLFFNDFEGSIKSLGAWGGDFVLVTSEDNPTAYFKNKGFDVIVPYSEMVLG